MEQQDRRPRDDQNGAYHPVQSTTGWAQMNVQTADAVVKAVVKMKYSLFPLKSPFK